MSARETGDARSDRAKGATTADKGTPIAVEVGTDRRSKKALLLFLAGPLIWTTHFLAVYLVVEAGCTGDGPGLNVFDPPVPTFVTLVATALAAAACVAAAIWGLRRWRDDEHEPPSSGPTGFSRNNRSLGFAGFLLSLLGLVVVLFVGLPAVLVPAC